MHKPLVFYTLLMLSAFGLAYLWPAPGIGASNGLKVWLVGLLFFSCLKIQARELTSLGKEWRFIGWLVLVRILAIPVLVYWLTWLFLPVYLLPFGLLVLMPVGITAAFFTGLLGGRVILTLALTVLTGFLTPVWLPFVLSTLYNREVQVNVAKLIGDLALILVLPLVIAEGLQLWLPRGVKWLNARTQKPTYFLLWLILLCTFSTHMDRLLKLSWGVIGETVLATFGLFALLALTGWLAAWKRQLDERIAAASGFMLMNYALAIYLATTFFAHEPLVILVAVLADVPWNGSVVALDFLLSRRKP